MVVQCPYCATRYQLDEARFNSPNPMLKCSRCRHVFPAPGSKKSSASAKAKKTDHPEDESLTLPFDSTSWKDEDAPVAPPEDDREGFVLGTEDQAEGEASATVEPYDEIEHAAEIEPVVGDEEEEAPEEVLPDLTFDEGDDDLPTAAVSESRREGNVVRAVLAFLLLVMVAYGLLTRALFSNPALAERLLGSVPLIGKFASDRLLARDVSLVGVRGAFQKIKSGKDVFVITGDVVSAAPIILSSVEVRGQLLDAEGKVLVEKTIYCGNVVSAKVLNDLTPREVSVLQKLAPPKQFAIRPGDSAGFVIVFMEPPAGAVELSTQVVEARA